MIRDFTIKYCLKLQDKVKIEKSVYYRLSREVDWGHLNIELAMRNLEHEACKGSPGSLFISRLSKVSDEAEKLDAQATKEKLKRFPGQNIRSDISLSGQRLHSDRDIHEAFRIHFCDYFARLLDLPIGEFSSYLAKFLHLQIAEVVRSEERFWSLKCVEVGWPQYFLGLAGL